MAKVSVKSVIEDGIQKGKTVKFILGQVAKKCPESKADESHVRFYANKMVRDGSLEAEVAQDKYGCGKRGRKPAEGKKAAPKKAEAKKATDKKPAVKKTTAKKKPAAKKSAASKK